VLAHQATLTRNQVRFPRRRRDSHAREATPDQCYAFELIVGMANNYPL